MILSLLTDDTLMHPDNLAPGVDVHTGKVDESNSANKYYGEVHTGNAWEPARAHYCGDNDANMPIALIVFGDKSHTDLHGSLAATPIIFYPDLFQQSVSQPSHFLATTCVHPQPATWQVKVRQHRVSGEGSG